MILEDWIFGRWSGFRSKSGFSLNKRKDIHCTICGQEFMRSICPANGKQTRGDARGEDVQRKASMWLRDLAGVFNWAIMAKLIPGSHFCDFNNCSSILCRLPFFSWVGILTFHSLCLWKVRGEHCLKAIRFCLGEHRVEEAELGTWHHGSDAPQSYSFTLYLFLYIISKLFLWLQ